MSRFARRRAALALTLVAPLMAGALGVAGATPAYADRCEPEEIVLGANSSPIDEDDNPVCTAFFFYVYPFVCAPSGDQPPATLLQCPSQLRLNPTYQPPLIPPYNPDTGRLVCNLVWFISPNTGCTATGDPETGTTVVTTDEGTLAIPGLPVLPA